MRIGLVDVDARHRLKKKKFGAHDYPNLALCKISAWHKANGDHVEWALPFEHYDKVYMSKIFNFSPDDDSCYMADEIIKGGTGYDVTSQLPPEMEFIQPDYSIYKRVPQDTAYGFLTRGCPNKCHWCVVPRKEGMVSPYMDIDEVLCGKKKAVLMDNNILALHDYAVSQLEKIIKNGYKVDFNQALDARLVTPDIAELLANVKWLDNRIRFGCDTKAQVQECQKAVDLIDSFGYKGEYFFYCMLHGSIDECYERIKHWHNLTLAKTIEHRAKRFYVQSQPFRDTTKINTPPLWQKDMAAWTNKRMIWCSTDFKDFEPRKGFKCIQYFKRQ